MSILAEQPRSASLPAPELRSAPTVDVVGVAANTKPRPSAGWLLKAPVTAMVLGFGVVLVRNAWIMEDAYILFRTIDNAIHGFGLTWNVTERVQTYTCPLWTFLLLPFHALTGEYYFTALAVSGVVSLGVVVMMACRVAPSAAAACLAVGLLTLSKGFVEYSTSGLENPLNHLLLAVFCSLYLGAEATANGPRLLCLGLTASLGMVNRLDTALLYGPALLVAFGRSPTKRNVAALALGMTPLLLWEAFSLVYYGFLFPNTAYAKLNLGIPAAAMWLQGLGYYLNALRNDLLTMAVIAGGLAAPLVMRRWPWTALSLGVLLYLLYIVKIGGDYMSMRFFTAPLVVAVALLIQLPLWRRPAVLAACLGTAFVLSWSMPACPLRNYEPGNDDPHSAQDEWQIDDLRRRFDRTLGLTTAMERWLEGKTPLPRLYETQRAALRHEPATIEVMRSVGRPAFRKAARLHVIDRLALGDAFLARLPMREGAWRVGHYERFIPEGYQQTLETGRNCLTDENLAKYYDELKLIISGDLWSWERWRAIWRINTGQLDHWIDEERYHAAR